MGPYAELTLTSPYVDSITCMYHRQPYARVDFILLSGTKNLALDLVVWFGSLESVATLDYCPPSRPGKRVDNGHVNNPVL
jgi:hypothetical protein